jgi:thymidine kinase
MFIEPKRGRGQGSKTGWVEVICGSMFSGKTEELIRRLKRAKIAQQKVEIFKPAIDVRYHESDIVSHNQTVIRSTPVHASDEILLMTSDCEVVGVDEAQFFDEGIVDVVNMDSKGVPFGPMPALMSIAEYVTKVHAICVVCGEIANYSYRKVANEQQVMLGELDSYEARCRKCFHLE